MSDFKKCLKLIKYGKNAKFNFIGGIVCIAAAAVAIAAVLAAEAGKMDVSAAKSPLYQMLFMPVYFMYLGFIFTYTPILSMFYTPHFNSSPIRKYAETKFIPVMFFLESLALIFFIALLGMLFSLKGDFAGIASATAMIYGSVFYGFIIVWSMAYIKYPWIIILIIPTAHPLYKLFDHLCVFIALNFSGISAALIAAGIAVIISIASSLLCYVINLIEYKKPYPKIWTKYQKVT